MSCHEAMPCHATLSPEVSGSELCGRRGVRHLDVQEAVAEHGSMQVL